MQPCVGSLLRPPPLLLHCRLKQNPRGGRGSPCKQPTRLLSFRAWKKRRREKEINDNRGICDSRVSRSFLSSLYRFYRRISLITDGWVEIGKFLGRGRDAQVPGVKLIYTERVARFSKNINPESCCYYGSSNGGERGSPFSQQS